MQAQAQKSQIGYHAGLSAEAIVARDYQRRGLRISRQRWRGLSGEVDLIAEAHDGALVFVEVKKSKSFRRAAERLTTRQMQRICGAAAEYLGTQPAGSLTETRFDLAMVDGSGATRIIENAFGSA